MNSLFVKSYTVPVFGNDVDALVPEVWAQEALLHLENNMVMGNLVYRDYSSAVANQGDVVNAHRPGSFVSKNKDVEDDVTVQDVTVTNVPVSLDQHHHVSFMLRDGEEAKAFKDLVATHLTPAVEALAQGVDEMIWGEAYNFMGNRVGQLQTDPTKATFTRLKAMMTNNKAPLAGRNLVITPNTESVLLDIADFVNAEKVGDAGTALREGSLGRKYGFDIFASQNAPSIISGANDVLVSAVNNASGYAVGSTVITVDTMTAAAAGSWVTIAGDMTPLMVASATATAITLASPGLRYAVADNAVVTVYEPALINLAAGYAEGWNKDVAIDDLTTGPQAGQLISQGSKYYGAKSGSTATALSLSNTLQSAAANNAVMGVGPAGEYGFAFHRNAIALVTRPLPTPRQGTGASSTVVNYNGLSMRVTITYNGTKQGHLVTLDFLTGIKTLDTRLGALLLA